MLRTGYSVVPRGMACLVMLVGCFEPAHADGRDEDLFIRPEDQRTVIFASADVSRSVFLAAGAKQTLVGPLDRPGFVAMETSGFGLTRERTHNGLDLPALRFVTQASSMIGYQQMWPGVFVAAYVGPELNHEQLTVAGQIQHISQPRLGARGQVEIWANPTPNSLLSATVLAGSTLGSIYGRTSAGYRLASDFFVGPEVTVYATETYRELRVGAHLTDYAIGIVHTRISGGWMTSDDHGRGAPYVGITAWIRM